MRDIINNSGTYIASVQYDAFGNVLSVTSPGALVADQGDYLGHYTYDTYYSDAATGYYDVNARVYSSAGGRWLSQDPMGFDAGDSNLYRYVNNRPTEEVDPSGLQKAFPFDPLEPVAQNAAGRRWAVGPLNADGFGINLCSFSCSATIAGIFNVTGDVGMQFVYDARNGEEALLASAYVGIGIGTPGLTFAFNHPGAFYIWGLKTGIDEDYSGLFAAVKGSAMVLKGVSAEAFVSLGTLLNPEICWGFGFGFSTGFNLIPSASLVGGLGYSWMINSKTNTALRDKVAHQVGDDEAVKNAAPPSMNDFPQWEKDRAAALPGEVGKAQQAGGLLKDLASTGKQFAKKINLNEIVLPQLKQKFQNKMGFVDRMIVDALIKKYPQAPLSFLSTPA